LVRLRLIERRPLDTLAFALGIHRIATLRTARHAARVLLSRSVIAFFASFVVGLMASTSAHASRFEDIGPSLGLPIGNPGSNLGKSLVAAISAADIDQDGDVDLIASEAVRGLVVYLREGAGFRLAPEWTGTSIGDAYGHTLFDMDGDGDLDVYLARSLGDRLYENQGDKLVDVTASRLPQHPGWSFTATAVDLDGDRDLDLVVARYIDRVEFPAHRCQDNLVFDNDGHGRFTDITVASGLRGTRGCSFVTLAFDLDGDHDLDLFTVNDFSQFAGANELWRNQGRDAAGHPHFVEVSAELGFHARVYGMGMAIEDLDQNGRLDFFMTNLGEPMLFELGADGRFVDNGIARHVDVRYAPDRNNVTWTTRALDLDGDGYLDLLGASGELSSASFIGNGPDLQNLWLRGQSDGTFVAEAPSEAFQVSGNSSRDFALVDVDGDERPEIVAIHMHGGISVLRDREFTPLQTRIALVPTMTAPGAAGAEVELSCDGVRRTRHVVGGGDYGNADLGELSFSFPAPCNDSGHALTGLVRWPSGYEQAITATSGGSARFVEDPWLIVVEDSMTVDLSGHLSSFSEVSATADGLVLGTRVTLGAGRWRWPVTRDPDNREGTITLALDGHAMGFVARTGRPPVELWFDVTSPTADSRMYVYARFASAPDLATLTFADSTETVYFAPFDGEVYVADLGVPAAGPTALTVDAQFGEDVVSESIPVEVGESISEERSDVIVRELHILSSDSDFRRVRLRLRLRDENNLPSEIPIEDLAVKIDGVLFTDVGRAYDADIPTLIIEHRLLHDGAKLQVVVQGRDRFVEQVVVQLDDGAGLGARVAAGPGARSFCAMSEPRLRADGVDRGAVLVQLFDARGTRLPDLGQPLLFDTDGVSVIARATTPGYGGWMVPVSAGREAKVGHFSARLAGQAVAVECAIELVAPPVEASVVGALLTSERGDPRVDAPALFRFVPQGDDGRALGSGVAFHFAIEGAEVDPLTIDGAASYVGLGRYEVSTIPRLIGPLTVSAVAPDGRVLARRAYDVPDPSIEIPEPGPELVEAVESDPEPVDEAPAEVVDVLDTSEETFDAAVETVSEVMDTIDVSDGPDNAEPVADNFEVVDAVETSEQVETVAPVDTSVGGGSDTQVDATPEVADSTIPEVSDPDPRRPRDEGCGTGASGSLLGLLATALFLALRGRAIRVVNPDCLRASSAPGSEARRWKARTR